ncbi:NADH dehydrogenase [ubiquinone] 1 alpha subcomplex subunit [Arachis hypogaea]|nr:NADH dehydrogenase [ubiquinone] 1 alpha subcomplex subunit [Arachis hypogaea]
MFGDSDIKRIGWTKRVSDGGSLVYIDGERMDLSDYGMGEWKAGPHDLVSSYAGKREPPVKRTPTPKSETIQMAVKVSGLVSQFGSDGLVRPTARVGEMMELEARRERVRQNVVRVFLKREEERRAKEGSTGKRVSPGKVAGPDLKSFIRQIPVGSEGSETEESSWARGSLRFTQENKTEKEKVEPKVEPLNYGGWFWISDSPGVPCVCWVASLLFGNGEIWLLFVPILCSYIGIGYTGFVSQKMHRVA